MKTAIYIENGSTQIVLTPENDFEKQAINSIELLADRMAIHRGSFYECRGGWMRTADGDDSLILRTTWNKPTEVAA